MKLVVLSGLQPYVGVSGLIVDVQKVHQYRDKDASCYVEGICHLQKCEGQKGVHTCVCMGYHGYNLGQLMVALW